MNLGKRTLKTSDLHATSSHNRRGQSSISGTRLPPAVSRAGPTPPDQAVPDLKVLPTQTGVLSPLVLAELPHSLSLFPQISPPVPRSILAPFCSVTNPSRICPQNHKLKNILLFQCFPTTGPFHMPISPTKCTFLPAL
jgi:hypothetical protein